VSGVENVRTGTHLSGEQIAIAIVSIANICLLVTAVFWRRREASERVRLATDAFWTRSASAEIVSRAWREQMGLIAVGLGLCNQVLFCVVEGALKEGWVPFDPGGNSIYRWQSHYGDLGMWMSLVTVLVALWGRGLRRYSAMWVGVASAYLWWTATFHIPLFGG
jgi:hypothetical protein